MARANSTFKGGGFFEKLLRFFNLLEPGGMVLSLSKVFVWLMMGVVVIVAIKSPAYLAVALPALAMAVANYGYRRYMQYQNGQPPYPTPPLQTPDQPDVRVVIHEHPDAAPTPDSAGSALDNLDLGGPDKDGDDGK